MRHVEVLNLDVEQAIYSSVQIVRPEVGKDPVIAFVAKEQMQFRSDDLLRQVTVLAVFGDVRSGNWSREYAYLRGALHGSRPKRRLRICVTRNDQQRDKQNWQHG